MDSPTIARRQPIDPGWRRVGLSLVRELSFRDFEEAFAFATRVAHEAVDYLRRPDICVFGFNRVRLTVANPHHAGIDRGRVATGPEGGRDPDRGAGRLSGCDRRPREDCVRRRGRTAVVAHDIGEEARQPERARTLACSGRGALLHPGRTSIAEIDAGMRLTRRLAATGAGLPPGVSMSRG